MIINKSELLIDYELPDGNIGSKGVSSNNVISELLNEQISIVKSANKTFLENNQEATYTIEITNNSDTAINNIVLKDIMTGEAEYVVGSVVINNVSQPTYDPKEGFIIPTINAKSSITVEYKIATTNFGGSDIIRNYASINYDVEDPTQGTITFEANSNNVEIKYIYVNANVFKSVDKKYVKSGDIITYTIVVSDFSNYFDNVSFLLQDDIPTGTTYVDGSLKINGTTVSGDISQGIYLTQYMVSGKATIEFKVTVN